MKIEVLQAALDDKPLIRRMLEFYEYDFSEYENTNVDSHGRANPILAFFKVSGELQPGFPYK